MIYGPDFLSMLQIVTQDKEPKQCETLLAQTASHGSSLLHTQCSFTYIKLIVPGFLPHKSSHCLKSSKRHWGLFHAFLHMSTILFCGCFICWHLLYRAFTFTTFLLRINNTNDCDYLFNCLFVHSIYIWYELYKFS